MDINDIILIVAAAFILSAILVEHFKLVKSTKLARAKAAHPAGKGRV